ncbi:DUF2877 domain-containing protein [Acidipropionibacterium virtanenii]|uniref:DUF2877 domain-containing protein n=1 Tax=Acidipropionibacterium virtanenii TaxID=2057246 RepID=A0A344UX98_9ACTN|nr:DUF2877 domain-containing protein [Acidipropionibacterium virtanenii]AXE39896.1 hypothetical protein JS278_02761 [Acidipropionibacterium virtanenii]
MTTTPDGRTLQVRALQVSALQVSAPVALLAGARSADRREMTGTLCGVHAHSVNLRARDAAGPLLVNLCAESVESVCQARICGPELRRLQGTRIGTPVVLRVSADDVVATRLSPSRAPRPFEVPASWFDSGEGDVYGRPRLERAARALAADRDVDALDELCGLGIGLTPSGDDALVGLIAASMSAGVGARARRRLAGRLRSGWAHGRTTEVSLTTLRLALAGDLAPPVLDLLAALTGPGAGLPAAQRPETGAVDRLARHGHTSGADLMAGVNALAEAVVCHEAAVSDRTVISEEGDVS